MKKKIVIVLWISLVLLVIAFCSLVVHQNRQEDIRLAKQEKKAEAEYQQQIRKQELAQKEKEEEKKKEEAEQRAQKAVEDGSYTFSDFEATYFAQKNATVREEPFDSAEVVGTLPIDQPVEIVAKCDQTSYYKIKVNGTYACISFDDVSKEYIDIPLPTPASKKLPTAKKDILFIGNSITMYPATKDWWGSGWGCGATSAQKDYVHRTVAAKGYSSFDFMSMRSWEFSNTRNNEVDDLDPYITKYKYNKIVIELGENVKGHETHFKEDFKDMIKYIHTYNPDAKIYVLDNFWPYKDIIKAKKEAAAETDSTFVSLSDIQNVASYQLQEGDKYTTPDGRTFTIGSFLAGHPNDNGFEAIAERLIDAL